MIVPMKKVSLVVMDREREAALEALRRVGVVHLEKRPIVSEHLAALLEKKGRAETVRGLLRSFEPTGDTAGLETNAVIDQVLAAADLRKAALEALSSDLKERSRIEGWGDFESEDFSYLADAGVVLVPYELPRKAYEALGEADRVIVLSADKTMVRCVSVGAPLRSETPFTPGDRSLSKLDAAIADRRRTLAECEASFAALAAYGPAIEAEFAKIIADIEFETARAGMEATADAPEGLGIAWLSGFVPDGDAVLVKAAAAEQGWAILIDDPSEVDSPPTKVRNVALVRLVQPVFDLLGTVPGYREYDISVSFLAFFMVFFAMIFGDGGYGSILLGLALIFGLKAKVATGKIPDGILLIGLLSSATIAWGAVTGTWFALSFQSLPAFLKGLVLPPFYPDPRLDPKEAAKLVQQNVKHLCFIIGTVQLVLAHGKNIKRALPSLTAIAQLGWLSMVLGLYFLVLNLVLDKTRFPVPASSLWMIGGGLAAYFVFAEQKGGNFFKNVLTSVGNFLPTFLSAVSSFSDIISYIRLFAVGLAGFAIAESFNGMAAGMPAGIIRIVAGGLILFFGHGLNLAMSALSVVVHGVRLNMLEYSGHLGMEWSGVKYAPFALKDEARR